MRSNVHLLYVLVVVGRIMTTPTTTTKDVHVQIQNLWYVTLYGKGILMETWSCESSKDLEMRKLSWVIQMSPNIVIRVLIRRKQGQSHRRRWGHRSTGQNDPWSLAKEYRGPLEAGIGKSFQKAHSPADAVLTSNLQNFNGINLCCYIVLSDYIY